MLKRYRYRAYPTPAQVQDLSRVFGCVRVVFNDFIAAREEAFKTGTPFESATALQSRLITQAKVTEARAWLAEVSSTPLQQAVRDAQKAYQAFFDSCTGKRKGPRMGKPRFKTRHDRHQAARFTRQCGFNVRQTTHGVGFVRIPKVGHLRFVLSRGLPSDPSSVSVIREADGRYYVSFVVIAPTPAVTPVHAGRTAGIDAGLIDFATIVYSDGCREKITNPRHLKARERRLTKAQRKLARKAKGSANREKARRKVAKEHRKVREARADFHHKLAARLVRENQTVVVEKLNVVGLARSGAKNAQGRGLRRAVADAGWGSFFRMMAENAAAHQRMMLAVNPAHTSQTCAACGVLDGPKPLNIRVWVCKACGQVLDRDYNAAVNIMVAAGLVETLNARGGDVRRQLAAADPSEARTHRKHAV